MEFNQLEAQIERDLKLHQRNVLGYKEKRVNNEYANIKARVDCNKPLNKLEKKARWLEGVREAQQAMIVKEKFRKQRRKRQELTIEKVEQLANKTSSIVSEQDVNVADLLMREVDVQQKLSLKEQIKF